MITIDGEININESLLTANSDALRDIPEDKFRAYVLATQRLLTNYYIDVGFLRRSVKSQDEENAESTIKNE